MHPSSTTVSAALRFSTADLEALPALTASPEATGWAFRLYHDAEDDLSILFVRPPFASPDAISIIPTAEGGVELTALEERDALAGVAFPTLHAALLAIGPHGADWSRRGGWSRRHRLTGAEAGSWTVPPSTFAQRPR